jgi:Tfp pilus assembly pilus retraction ATPase PilT
MSPDKAMQIRNTIETSRTFGMQTLESHLNELVANGEIDIAEARAASLFPSEIAQTQTNGYRRKS